MLPRTITDFDIQALVDNELGREEQKRVRAYIETMPEAGRRYEELLRQKLILQEWWTKGGFSH